MTSCIPAFSGPTGICAGSVNGVVALFVLISTNFDFIVAPMRYIILHNRRDGLSTSRLRSQQNPAPTFDPKFHPRPPRLPFHALLTNWQRDHGAPTDEILSAFENHPARISDVQNVVSKLNLMSTADEHVQADQWNDMDDDDGDDLITIGLFLKPGDVVELSQPGREPILAVFVQQLDSSSQFFSVSGRWCHSTISRVAFAITGCIDPGLLQPLIPFMPTSPHKANPKGEVHVPAEFATPVQRSLERMTHEAEQIYRSNAPVLDTAYAVLADPERTRMMTLSQIAQTLLAPNDSSWTPSPAALLAVRKSLRQDEFRFRADMRSHRLTNVFEIRSKRDVKVVETVHEWIRRHREFLAASATMSKQEAKKQSYGPIVAYITEFLDKARRLIAQSRKNREPNIGFVGPSRMRMSRSKHVVAQSVLGEPFNDTDKQIIHFLQAWVLTGQYVGMDGLHSACVSLIMSTGCYEIDAIRSDGLSDGEASDITRATGMLFLQEIGVIMPYENRILYDEQLMLPTVHASRDLDLLNANAEAIRKDPKFIDSMRHLRHDWGSSVVYCIDDIGAQEVDDGISIERVDGNTSEFWIHVHVANPTAFFDKTHTLSGLAAHMTETFYTPERSFPMLPVWASQGHFSLDRGRPVLTISSRVDATGNVLEKKIQSGIVQEIVTITPSEVASVLGGEKKQESKRFVVGGEPLNNQPSAKKPKVSPQQLQDLQDMYTVAQRLWETRKAHGAVRMQFPRHSVRVFESPSQAGLTWNPPSTDRSRLVFSDPIIEVSAPVLSGGAIHFGIDPMNIVEEMMLLACSTAAAWCTERNIPVMYRGTIAPPTGDTLSPEEIKTRYILPHIEKSRQVPLNAATRYISSLGRAITHSAPLPHKIIGVPGYVKVTSPLRRFGDMIAHWQIEAALRFEARTGRTFDGAKASTRHGGVIPFSQRQIQEFTVTLAPREKLIKGTKISSVRFWSILALMRAFYYKEAPLPEVFRFWVRQIPNDGNELAQNARGVLPDYGYDATLRSRGDVKVGDEWEVELERIDVFGLRVYVKPVRLLNREEELL
ncbi:3'-5' RNA exonuclease complex component [Pleosporales sp. CAS-2024a]